MRPGSTPLAVYLAVHQHLPYDRVAQLFADVVGIEVSVGALAQMVAEARGALGFFSAVVRDVLQEAWCEGISLTTPCPATPTRLRPFAPR